VERKDRMVVEGIVKVGRGGRAGRGTGGREGGRMVEESVMQYASRGKHP